MGLAAAAGLSACASLEQIPVSRTNPAEVRTVLEPGDFVVVRTWTGEETRFEVKRLEADAIMGTRGQRVAYADIQMLDVSEADVGGTVKTALAATALVVVALAFLVLDAELEEDRTRTYCDQTGCDTR